MNKYFYRHLVCSKRTTPRKKIYFFFLFCTHYWIWILRPFFKEIVLLAQIVNVENECSIFQFGNFEKKKYEKLPDDGRFLVTVNTN